MQKQTIGSEQTLQSPFVTQFRFNCKKLFKSVRQQFWFHSYCTYTAPLFNLIFRYFICSNLRSAVLFYWTCSFFCFFAPSCPRTFVNVFLCFSCVLVSSFCRSSILSCSFFLFPRTFVSSLANLKADIDLLVILEIKGFSWKTQYQEPHWFFIFAFVVTRIVATFLKMISSARLFRRVISEKLK